MTVVMVITITRIKKNIQGIGFSFIDYNNSSWLYIAIAQIIVVTNN